jgi:hypothetical protein
MNQQGRSPGSDASGPEFGVNHGLYIRGDVGALATGDHGQATQITYGSGTADPLELIDQLLRKLEADASVLRSDEAEDVIDDAHRLHTEVHSRKLSAENIRAVLSRLSTATTSTATLLATVDQIKDLITVLLH